MAYETVRDYARGSDLNNVIDAIRTASDRELKAIQGISNLVKSALNGEKGANNNKKSAIKPESNQQGKDGKLQSDKKSEVIAPKGDNLGQKGVINRLDSIIAINNKIKKVSDGKAQKNTNKVIGNEVSNSITKSKYDQFWSDEKGRLRRPDGRYASKDDQKGYANSKQSKVESEQEKSTSLLGNIFKATKATAGVLNGTLFSTHEAMNSTGGAAAGALAGGPMFYAAKEIFDAGSDVYNNAKAGKENIANVLSSLKSKQEDKKSLKLQKQQLKLAKNEEKLTRKNIAGSVVAKDKALKRDQLEVLKEQSSEDTKFHSNLLKQIDTLKLSIIKSGGDGGIIDSVVGSIAGAGGAVSIGKTILSKFTKAKPGALTSVESKGLIEKGKSFNNVYKNGGKVSFLESLGHGAGVKSFIKKVPWLGSLITGGVKAYDLKDRSDLSNTQKGVQIASTTIGSTGGTMAGATAGAAAGTLIFPGVGTAIGGIAGAIVGGIGGENIGDKLGEQLSKYIGKDNTLPNVIEDAFKSSADYMKSIFGGNTGSIKSSPLKSVSFNSGDKVEDRINQYSSIITAASKKYNVPENLIKSVIRQESGGINSAKSGVGAVGLMQLMKPAASEMGVTNRNDPYQNIMGGTGYLAKKIKEMGGDVNLGLAAYNYGAGAVKRTQRKTGLVKFNDIKSALPSETRGYVENISGTYAYRSKKADNIRLKGSAINKVSTTALIKNPNIKQKNANPVVKQNTNTSKSLLAQSTENQHQSIQTEYKSDFMRYLSWDFL